jgi:hypothetical protein
VIGESSRFIAILLGHSHLAEGYLARPDDATQRVVAERDRIGHLPPL